LLLSCIQGKRIAAGGCRVVITEVVDQLLDAHRTRRRYTAALDKPADIGVTGGVDIDAEGGERVTAGVDKTVLQGGVVGFPVPSWRSLRLDRQGLVSGLGPHDRRCSRSDTACGCVGREGLRSLFLALLHLRLRLALVDRGRLLDTLRFGVGRTHLCSGRGTAGHRQHCHDSYDSLHCSAPCR